jgi:hypothetical protein
MSHHLIDNLEIYRSYRYIRRSGGCDPSSMNITLLGYPLLGQLLVDGVGIRIHRF